jgi:DNA-3-methyladenine glycosylase
MNGQPLPAETYLPNAVITAQKILGMQLVRRLPSGEILLARIVETEAYTGHDDLASHGRVRKTPRNLPMWGAPGRAYVYLCRGMYWMLNVVAEPAEQPAAVLIRAAEPLQGQATMAALRGIEKLTEKNSVGISNGPSKLAQAMCIDKALNTVDLTSTEGGLWLEAGNPPPADQIASGPRINLGKRVTEPWLSIAWRFWLRDNRFVSRG